MPARIELDVDRIVELYESGLSSIKIATRFKVSKPTILKRLKEFDIDRRKRKYIFNESSFSTPFSAENCYWAGFIAADGWIQNNRISIELNSIDDKHLNKFRDFIDGNNNIRYRKRERSDKIIKYCSIGINSGQIVNDLKNNYNIVERKSVVLKPPEKIPNNLINHYLRGIFDGDGCIRWDKGNFRITFVSGSFDFLNWVKLILKNNLKIGNPNVRRKNIKENSSDHYLSFSGNRQVPIIMDWLYEDCKNNFLKRKKVKYNNLLEVLK